MRPHTIVPPVEHHITVSDGVILRALAFSPLCPDPESPVIVFVAGWISHIDGWTEFLETLSPRYRILYIETREKRSSQLPADRSVSFTMERLALDLREIIDHLLPDDEHHAFVLSGSSLGATVVLEYCASGYRPPRSCTLIAPTPEFIYPRALNAALPLIPPATYGIIKPALKWYLAAFRLDSSEVEQIQKYHRTLDDADPRKLKANALALRLYRVWERLPLIQTPTLIIGARSDSLHSTDGLKKMRDLITNAEYRELASNKETHSGTAANIMMEYIETLSLTAQETPCPSI